MRFYSVSLDDGGTRVSWRDMASMVAHLPSESALRRSTGDGWSESERLLASMLATMIGQEVASPNRRAQIVRQRQIPLEEKKRIVAEAYGYDEEVLNG